MDDKGQKDRHLIWVSTQRQEFSYKQKCTKSPIDVLLVLHWTMGGYLPPVCLFSVTNISAAEIEIYISIEATLSLMNWIVSEE